MSVTVSVPGKIMLFGEHAVVYGMPCIVSSVNRLLHITATKENKSDRFTTPDSKDNRFLTAALNVFRKRYNIHEHVSIGTKSGLGQYGLGSSASVTAGLVQALAKLFQVPLTEKEWFDVAYEAVLSVQQQASGFDVASCIWEGTIRFDGKLKIVKSLTNHPLPIVVGYSGIKGDTTSMIEKVRQFKKSHPKEAARIFRSIAKLIPQAVAAIRKKDWPELGKLMNTNHELLHRLGVSTRTLDAMVIAAYATGAYGAKLSGAGGGDCMVAVVSKQKRKDVEQAITRVGGTILPIIVG